MDSQFEDKLLVEQAQKGNKKAFDTLILKYQYRIGKLMIRYANDSAEAHDLAQETFMKVFNNIDKFRGDSGFYTWLYRIAINTAKNHAAYEGRRPPIRDIDIDDAERYLPKSILKDFGTPEHLLLCHEMNDRLNKAIDDLPEELRLALLLRERENRSYEEIAHIMHCPVGTVRSRIFRARETLTEYIKHLL